MSQLLDENYLARMDQEFTGWSDPVEYLHGALANDELSLYYQPIRALGGARDFPMAEVLVRLRKEESALLPPGDFLPVFEHYRMMPHLDRWVVRTVARRVQEGSRIACFTINLSGQTLEDADFPDFLAAQIRATGIPPGSILFEIDEADLIARPWASEVFGAALRKLGSGTLIDGFGRRSVSFTPLKSLRADYIKVDGSITRQVLTNSAAETKMQAVVRVGAALGIGIIAECVEEQDILTRLKALGAGYAQGFGIARPHPIEALAGVDAMVTTTRAMAF